MKNWPEQLYRLLPAVHQIRDADQAEALRLLIHVVGEQVQDVQDDIESLYENWFIETCEDWVVPYLGDLVGFQLAGDAGSPGDAINTRSRMLNRFLYPRREIANAVRRRRRKGTLSVLEDLASDVTRWPSRAVEFSQSVVYCQNVQHPEPHRGGTALLIDHSQPSKRPTHVQLANAFNETPFNAVAHTVDTRAIQSLPGVGWYHPNKIGLFVWRRPVYSATRFTPCRICCNDSIHIPAYTFDRLGRQLPLYVNRKQETDETHIAGPENLPVKLTRILLRDKDGLASTDYYGLDNSKSLSISAVWEEGGTWESIPASQVHVCDLQDGETRFSIRENLDKKHVAVDPEMGVVLMSAKDRSVCPLRVSYRYAFGGDLGGGEYDRRAPRYRDMNTVRIGRSNSGTEYSSRYLFDELDRLTRSAAPSRACPTGSSPSASSLIPDQIDLADGSKRTRGWQLNESLCIEITTSDTFIIRAWEVLEVAPNKTLEIRSAPGTWPLLLIKADGPHKCGQPWTIKLGAGSRLILAGLQIVGETLDLVKSAKPDLPETSLVTCTPCSMDQAPQTFKPIVPAEVIIRHTTFVPPASTKSHHCCEQRHPSLIVRLKDARIVIQRSILGTIDLDHPGCHGSRDNSHCDCPLDPIQVHISDSIIDAACSLPAIYSKCCTPAHADLTVQRSTIFGSVCVQQISKAENSLFVGLVRVQRRSIGYMRFCYVPRSISDIPVLIEGKYSSVCRDPRSNQTQAERTASRTPQRFKCLPDTDGITQANSCSKTCDAVAVVRPGDVSAPVFVSTCYGDAGYAQLALHCPQSILRGADDESELGAFHDLFHPQRMAALESRLQEYTPADIQSSVIYADDLDLPPRFYDVFRSL